MITFPNDISLGCNFTRWEHQNKVIIWFFSLAWMLTVFFYYGLQSPKEYWRYSASLKWVMKDDWLLWHKQLHPTTMAFCLSWKNRLLDRKSLHFPILMPFHKGLPHTFIHSKLGHPLRSNSNHLPWKISIGHLWLLLVAAAGTTDTQQLFPLPPAQLSHCIFFFNWDIIGI